MNKIKITILTFFIVLINTFLLEEVLVMQYAHFIYLIQFLFISAELYYAKNNYYYFLSPSFITLLYLNYNFILGHYVILNDFGLQEIYHKAFVKYESQIFITNFLLICNLIVCLTIPKIVPTFLGQKKAFKSTKYIFYLFGILIFFASLNIDLAFLGGAGNFNYAFELGISILLVHIISNFKGKIKFIFYLLLILLYVIFHYDSKREIFFLIILVIFFEIIKNRVIIKINLKQFFLSLIGLGIAFYIILLSSILRGYGNFNVDNPLDASRKISEYVEMDIFKDALVNNFELATVYGNSSNAINYVYTNQVELLYGSTLIKFLFIPIPRSLIQNKPRSMVDIYTSKFQPNFREIGGSLPITFYSEVFWNFHILGLIVIFLFYFYFNKAYAWTIKSIESNNINTKTILFIYLYITIIQFIRGAGLETWILYPLVSLPLIYLITMKFKNQNH